MDHAIAFQYLKVPAVTEPQQDTLGDCSRVAALVTLHQHDPNPMPEHRSPLVVLGGSEQTFPGEVFADFPWKLNPVTVHRYPVDGKPLIDYPFRFGPRYRLGRAIRYTRWALGFPVGNSNSTFHMYLFKSHSEQ